MVKHRITLTAVIEFEVNPKHYPNLNTPQERLALDIEQAREDPDFAIGMNEASWTITGEIIPENGASHD